MISMVNEVEGMGRKMDRTTQSSEARTEMLYLSSNFTIYPLFSRGCLYSPRLELGEEYAFPAPHSDAFVAYVSGFPEKDLSEYENTARNLVPIGIVARSAVGDHPGLMRRSILLSDVERLIFRSEKDLKRFALSPFSDVDMSSIAIEMTVDETKFGAASEASSEKVSASSDLFEGTSHPEDLRKSDAYGGLLCALLNSARGKRAWFEFLKTASPVGPKLRSDEELRWISTIGGAATGKSKAREGEGWEEAILSIVSRQLLELKVSEGWPAKRLLSELTQSAVSYLTKAGMDQGVEKVRAWSEQSHRVLDDDAPLPALSDDGSIVLRALLLLLVHESAESLLALRENRGEERVGNKVWRLSFALAAFHEGLRGLPKELKYQGSTDQARARVEFLGEAVERCHVAISSGDGGPSSSSAMIEEFDDGGTASIGLSWNGRKVLSLPMEISPALRKAASDCRYYGFDVGRVGAEYFEVSSGPEEHLDAKVQVSVWHDPNTASEILRFKATAFSLATKASSKTNDPVKALEKNRQLNKANLISMLLSNAEESQNCRVALQTDPLAVIVVVDQMLDTMDREECVAHLRNVSTRARSLGQLS